MMNKIPSDQIRFNSGDKLRITGPDYYPFTLLITVQSKTRKAPAEAASKRTRLKTASGRLYLEHACDVGGFTLRWINTAHENGFVHHVTVRLVSNSNRFRLTDTDLKFL